MPETLDQLVMTRRVLVTVGAGGVGKTTTAAALGVAAASRGRRVLCLTIDPARRLAEALGLERMSGDEQTIAPALFEAVGVPMKGSLTAMMLDTKRTFDELVIKYSSSPERAKKLMDNKLYQYVSTSLAGTQEYMAMEKLVAVQRDPRFDLVILDTPPTANALDFLDAPGRLVEARRLADDALVRPGVRVDGQGRASTCSRARRPSCSAGLGRITGGGFLAAMAEFITELNDLFGGFKQRAQMVESSLRSPEVSFVLVTSPAPVSLEEAIFFSERLGTREHAARRVRREPVPVAAVVDRRASPRRATPRAPSPRAACVSRTDAPERVVRAHADAVRLAARDAANVEHPSRAGLRPGADRARPRARERRPRSQEPPRHRRAPHVGGV